MGFWRRKPRVRPAPWRIVEYANGEFVVERLEQSVGLDVLVTEYYAPASGRFSRLADAEEWIAKTVRASTVAVIHEVHP